MDKKNICRPIVLYNNFVPPTEEVQVWDYCAFGTCDGIDVGINVVDNNKMLLNAIWDHQKEFCEKLCGKYSAQVIYAIKYGLEEQDEIFWNDETAAKYPFTFFVRIQCVSNVDKLWENREKLEQGLAMENKIVVNTYLTYDNSDLLVILKSIGYEEGARMINTLHHGVNLIMSEGTEEQCVLKNSFTIVAIKRDHVNKIADKKIAGIIPEIDVRMIEKQNGGIAKVEEVLRNKYPQLLTNDNFRRKQILGEDDEVFSFKGIPWSLFISFYQDYEGIFNNANEEYKMFLSGTTAVIAMQAEVYVKFPFIEKSGGEEEREELLFGEYLTRMNTKLARLGNGNGCELYKELYLIINSLSKFVRPVFADYMFTMMLGTMDSLLDLIASLSAKYGGGIGSNGKDYYDFIKSFNIYSQNSVRSDRHSMQIMDINAKMYNIPVKLNAFYTTYIYRICDLLNKQTKERSERKIRYDFFTVPGSGDKVSVRELYKRVMEERRLIKVEIPERRFYDVKGMMSILSHEVAHYVGRAIRNRDVRYNCMIENIAHVYVNYVFHILLKKGKNKFDRLIDDNIRSEVDKKMSVMLLNALNRELDETFLKEQKLDERVGNDIEVSLIVKENERLNYYIAFIKSHLKIALNDISQYGLKNVFAPVFYVLADEQCDDILTQISKISDRFLFEHSEKSTLLSMKTMMSRLVMVYEECFADLMSIMLLKMTLADYLDIIIADAAQQGIDVEELSRLDIMFRCLLVMLCMLKESADGNGYAWNLDEVSEAGKNKKYAVIVSEMASLYEEHILQEHSSYMEADYDKNCVNVLRDGIVLNSILGYLKSCKQMFIEIRKSDTYEESDLINTIVKIFRDSKISESGRGSNIEARMIAQLRFIMQYKNDLEKELQNEN